MSDVTCSILNGETVDLVREFVALCRSNEGATPELLGMDDQSLNMVISSPDGGWLECQATLEPTSRISYNRDNGHLVAKLQLGKTQVPVVIDTKHEGLFAVSVFPLHLAKLKQRARAAQAA